MPSLGADMDEGMVVKWLVSPGDIVHRGDLVAEVETQKGIIEAEIWDDGIIEEFLVELGRSVPVGTPIVQIGPLLRSRGRFSDRPRRDGRTPPQCQVPAREHGCQARSTDDHCPRRPPPIRHLAHELGVDLDRVVGTGENGEVTRADIHAAAERPTPVDSGWVRGDAARQENGCGDRSRPLHDPRKRSGRSRPRG